jgi:hypothetical protein
MFGYRLDLTPIVWIKDTIFGQRRLKPGITVQEAKAAMKLAAEQFKEKFPKALSGPDGTRPELLIADAATQIRHNFGKTGGETSGEKTCKRRSAKAL